MLKKYSPVFLRNPIAGLALIEQRKVKGASDVGIIFGETDQLAKGLKSFQGSVGVTRV